LTATVTSLADSSAISPPVLLLRSKRGKLLLEISMPVLFRWSQGPMISRAARAPRYLFGAIEHGQVSPGSGPQFDVVQGPCRRLRHAAPSWPAG